LDLSLGVMGAGAVGCYVGGRLARVPGVRVTLVGRPRLRDEVRAEGLRLTDLDGDEVQLQLGDALRFETEPTALAACDVVLCCVKSGHTDEVAASLAEVVAPDALLVSLQNGVRNPDVLRARLPGRTVLPGVVEFNVVSQEGGFRHTTQGALLLEASSDPRAVGLVAALRACGLAPTTYPDLAAHQWCKLLVNLSNAVSALSGAPTRDLILTPGYRRVMRAVMKEGLRVVQAARIPVARLRGVPLRSMLTALALPTPLVRLVARAQLKVDPEARSSMWQDLARGRLTEVDYLNGEIVRVADRHGVDAPLNRRLVELVHGVEARGDGSPQLSPQALWTALTQPA
jgi:2-dehydropantoate 2-reductase